MSQDELFINGELLRLRREARGWVLNDMATRACMSVKQIRQLEEGGMSAFYSSAVKVTAAKKVAALLGLSAEDVFAKTRDPAAEVPLHAVEVEASEHVATSQVVETVLQESASHDSDEPIATTSHPELRASVSAAAASDDAAPKSKTSFLTIVVLFAVALAVAAYLQPKEEPPVEAAPPVQVLPGETTDPASAASAAISASSSDVAAVVGSVSVVARSASPAVALPATSAASKAP